MRGVGFAVVFALVAVGVAGCSAENPARVAPGEADVGPDAVVGDALVAPPLRTRTKPTLMAMAWAMLATSAPGSRTPTNSTAMATVWATRAR
jgi:hypothetical protein